MIFYVPVSLPDDEDVLEVVGEDPAVCAAVAVWLSGSDLISDQVKDKSSCYLCRLT